MRHWFARRRGARATVPNWIATPTGGWAADSDWKGRRCGWHLPGAASQHGGREQRTWLLRLPRSGERNSWTSMHGRSALGAGLGSTAAPAARVHGWSACACGVVHVTLRSEDGMKAGPLFARVRVSPRACTPLGFKHTCTWPPSRTCRLWEAPGRLHQGLPRCGAGAALLTSGLPPPRQPALQRQGPLRQSGHVNGAVAAYAKKSTQKKSDITPNPSGHRPLRPCAAAAYACVDGAGWLVARARVCTRQFSRVPVHSRSVAVTT